MTLFDPRLKKRNYKEINTVQELYAVLFEPVTPKQLLSKYQLEVKKDFWIPFGFYKGSCITNFLRLIGFYK